MVENNKYCAICANDMHLVVMLVPYIEKELENGEEVVTVLERSLKGEVDTLISNINLGKSRKDKIKNINWRESILTENEMFNIRGKNILVKGSYDFIDRVNGCLNTNENKVINCFDLDTFEENSREILENHDFILNTLGIKKISDVFHTKWLKNSILTK